MASPRVFLDACVLFPPLVRALLVGSGRAGIIDPWVSPRVLGEWQRAAARKQGVAVDPAGPGLPEAVPDPELTATLHLPDPDDAHVLAGAVAAGAAILVTFNLRDFPRRALAVHGIEARHPDSLLWERFGHDPSVLAPVIARALDEAGIAAPGAKSALKRARLPRLAKAWAASGLA